MSLRRAAGVAASLVALLAAASAAAAPSAEEVKQHWCARLAGRHFSAQIRMSIDRSGKGEIRRLQVWRADAGEQRERLMARFVDPADLRGFAVLYLEQPDRQNDYFVYQPAAQRVRRIGAAAAREDIYGIDLEYLGFGAAQIVPTAVEAVAETSLDGHPVLRLTERATEHQQRFERRIVWLDPSSWIPLRAEHERDGATTLVARTLGIRDIQGVPTPARVVFERPLDHETIDMEFESVDYEAPIPSSFFSTLELIKR